MGILSTIPKKRKRRTAFNFLGSHIPKEQADYITLYCNAYNITKSSIVLNLIQEWVKKTKLLHPINELEQKIVQNAFIVWGRTRGETFETFKAVLKQELKYKKLDVETIGRILILLEDEKNKST